MEIEALFEQSRRFNQDSTPDKPFYHLVPKTLEENLKFRQQLIDMAWKNDEYAHDLWVMCQKDILFWANAFCWTYDPRKVRRREGAVLPFITYPFQDRALLELQAVLGEEVRVMNKSRDQGASWISILTWCHSFQFISHTALGMVSRKETYVDKTGSKKTLFGKLDMLLKSQPDFLVPRYDRQYMYIENKENNSYIEGESTTDNIFTGNRLWAVFVDEFAKFERNMAYAVLASLTSVTNCVIYNSTNTGFGNAYADLAHDPNIKRIDMFWYEHPEKNIGLYTSVAGELKIIDKTHAFPKGYEFILDGRYRSPWYDLEWRKQPVKKIIAQEIDGDFGAAGGQYFPKDVLLEHQQMYVKDPIHTGYLQYDKKDTPVPSGFESHSKGNLKLWTELDLLQSPSHEQQFVIGCDISQGTGASNSAAVVYNTTSREKAAELVTSTMLPHEFTELVIALCRWFNSAFLIWEANGPGATFTTTVINLGYRNIYYKTTTDTIVPKRGQKPGWFTVRQNKKWLIDNYIQKMAEGQIINRSTLAVAECGEYLYDDQGYPEHFATKDTVDLSGARENHGDTVIADALCAMVMGSHDDTILKQKKEEPKAMPGSLAFRRLEREQEALALSDEGMWPE